MAWSRTPGGAVRVRRLGEPFDLLQIQELRDGLPLLWSAQMFGGIGGEAAFAQQKRIETAQGGQVPGDRPAAQPGLI